MNFEKGPQFESREHEVEKRTGQLMGRESELLENVDEGKIREIRKSGKLKKFLGTMVLASALAGASNGVEAAGQRGTDWRRVGNKVERAYDDYSYEKRRRLRRELQQLSRELHKLDREASRLFDKYQEEMDKAHEAGDNEKWNEIVDEMIKAMEPYKKRDEELRKMMDEIEDSLNREKKIQTGKAIVGGILDSVLRR